MVLGLLIVLGRREPEPLSPSDFSGIAKTLENALSRLRGVENILRRDNVS